MVEFLLLGIATAQLWYSVPLIVAVSLVYAGTRHEQMAPIISHAARFATWIVVFMAALMLVLWLVSKSL